MINLNKSNFFVDIFFRLFSGLNHREHRRAEIANFLILVGSVVFKRC